MKAKQSKAENFQFPSRRASRVKAYGKLFVVLVFLDAVDRQFAVAARGAYGGAASLEITQHYEREKRRRDNAEDHSRFSADKPNLHCRHLLS